jgi:hypothetical protein
MTEYLSLTDAQKIEFAYPVPPGIDSDVLPFAGATLFRGEADAVRTVLKAGAEWGYGNMIAHLKREWAENLVRRGLSVATALESANVSAYPLRKGVAG